MSPQALPSVSLVGSDSASGRPASEVLDDLMRGGWVESLTVGASPLAFSVIARGGTVGHRYRVDFVSTRRIAFDPERMDLDVPTVLVQAGGLVKRVVCVPDGQGRQENGTIRLVLDLFDVDVSADRAQFSAWRDAGAEETPGPAGLTERFAARGPDGALYTGMNPWAPGSNTTIDVGLERLEVDELYLVESFTVDFTNSWVDVALRRRDGTGMAQLRFDRVTDVCVQPDRYDGDAAIEESLPPPSMGMDGFDEVTVLPPRSGATGGRFLVIVGAFDLLIETPSVQFIRD